MNKNNYKKILTILFGIILFFPSTSSASLVNKTISQTLTSGLVGHWTMDGKDSVWTSSTAGTVIDKSGNGNTGTFTNMAIATAPALGKIGQAMKFDGVDDYVNIADPVSGSLDFGTGDFSISHWVKFNDFTDDSNGLISKDNYSGSSTYNGWLINLSNGGGGVGITTRNVVSGTGPATNARWATANFSLGTWYLISAVRSSNVLYLYVNGVQRATGTESSATNVSNSQDISFSRLSAASPQYFAGNIDDVRIYNRALSATEVAQLYQLGASKFNATPTLPLTSGLVGHWTMDGKDSVWTSSTAGTVVDKSGNGNTGTLTNMAIATAPVVGKIGQAMKFDGSNDYIVDSSAPVTAVPLTMSYWAYLPSALGTNPVTLWLGQKEQNIWRAFYSGVSSTGAASASVVQNNDFGGASSPTGIITVGKWHHVTAVFNTNSQEVYVDGVSKGTGSHTAVPTGINTLTIGASWPQSAGPDNHFPGRLDDVRIYNRALSATEAAQLYQLGASKFNATPTLPLTSGLVGHWTMDGKDSVWTSSTAGTVVDKSGNGNTGTLTNMAIATAPALGKIGQALKFDGPSQDSAKYVSVGSTTALNLQSTDFSITMWVKPVVNNWASYYTNLIGKRTNGTQDTWELYLQPGTGKLGFYSNPSPGTGLQTSNQTIPTAVWSHIGVVLSGTTMTFYFNGVAVDTKTGVVVGPSSSANVQMGYFQGTPVADEQQFYGSQDDVRIYNRALSATEIEQLYNMGR